VLGDLVHDGAAGDVGVIFLGDGFGLIGIGNAEADGDGQIVRGCPNDR